MDDEARRKGEAVGHHRVPGRAATDGAAGLLQPRRAGGPVDGAVDATAATQTGIGRVDDGVDRLSGDVASHRFELRRHGISPPPAQLVELVLDVGGTIFSSDTAWAGAFSVVFSPQFVNVTVPWMVELRPLCPGLVTSWMGRGAPVAGM